MNLRALDALRGLLAVYVLLGHSRWLLWTGHAAWMQQPHEAWAVPLVYLSAGLRYGREAVMVFFVLSGFFIHLRNAGLEGRERLAPQSTSRYLGRRAHRLLPPYVFALAITVVCDAIGGALFPRLYDAHTGDALLDQAFQHSGYRPESIVPALVLLPSSLGVNFGSNGPLWSLAFEVIYYLLYPLWYLLRRRSAAAAFALVPAICLAMTLLPATPFPVVVLAYYPAWLAGAFLAERIGDMRPSRHVVAGAAAIFAAGALLHVSVPSLPASAVAAILFGGAAVAGFALYPSDAGRVWWRMWEYLGIRSYTIYAVHFPFLALLSAWWIQTYGARPAHGWLALVGGLFAIGFGCLCFEICERHFLHRAVVPRGPVGAHSRYAVR